MTFRTRVAPRAPAAGPSVDYGFNFRATPSYGGGGELPTESFVNLGVQYNYPSTDIQNNNGATAGWETRSGNPQARDRASGNDRRLRGTVYCVAAALDVLEFRVAITGMVKVSLALGDPIFTNVATHYIYDGPSSGSAVWTGDNIFSPTPQFLSADKTSRTAADWVTVHDAGDTAKFFWTFNNYFLIRYTSPSGSNNANLSHLRLET